MEAMKSILEEINDLLIDPEFPQPVKDVLQKTYEELKGQSIKLAEIEDGHIKRMADILEQIKEGNTKLVEQFTQEVKKIPLTPEISLDLSALEKSNQQTRGLLETVIKLFGKLRSEGLSANLNQNKDSNKYVSVRLTDGKTFYKAFGGGSGGAGGGPSFLLDNGQYSDFRGDEDGNLKVSASLDVTDLETKVDAIASQFTAVAIKSAVISTNTSGDTALVAAVSGKKIRVLSYAFNVAGTVQAYFKRGNTALTGAMTFQAREGVAINGGPYGLFETNANEALNLNLSAEVYAYGHVTYTLV